MKRVYIAPTHTHTQYTHTSKLEGYYHGISRADRGWVFERKRRIIVSTNMT